MKGMWSGFYQFKNEADRKIAGFDKTNFTITINSFDGRNFSGVVQDDVTTGGMKEEGKIAGYIEGDVIFFTKHMPKTQQIVDRSGTRQNLDQPHPILYYSGRLSEDKHHAEGKWRFKVRIVFLLGFIPFPWRIGSGYWSMQLNDH